MTIRRFTLIVRSSECWPAESAPADGPVFRVGAAGNDITPPAGIPMWGYGAAPCAVRGHAGPAHGQSHRDLLGDDKVALVGIDLGRGPTEEMMKTIRQEIADRAGIHHVLITGSHTHHGPVIELIDEPGLERESSTSPWPTQRSYRIS